jgi:nucleotide-binding universal stress UspA family protein
MYERILVPLDLSDLAETILPHALEIARCFKAELLLFHVSSSYAEVFQRTMPAGAGSTMNAEIIQQIVDSEASEGQRYLNTLAGRYHAEHVEIRQILAQGTPARAILQYCDDQEISLVTMSTHGKSGLARTLLGSVADEVMRNSRLPVLLLRPDSV